MSFLNENTAQGIPLKGTFQAGLSDIDKGNSPETGVSVPWSLNPQFTWMDGVWELGVRLDSGIVVHRILPQQTDPEDSLGTIDVTDPQLLANGITGTSFESQGKYTDLKQRMAHSVYRFVLKGWARRAGYQVSFPKLLQVGGVPAIPDDDPVQAASNTLIGNYSGIPIWLGRWELWYTVTVPIKGNQKLPSNLAEQINADDALPKTGIQVPITYPDANAVQNGPLNLPAPIKGQ